MILLGQCSSHPNCTASMLCWGCYRKVKNTVLLYSKCLKLSVMYLYSWNVQVIQTQLQILLLSLTAGGVGLNLVGGNHLLLVDLHWNPQLELQAQDRIYRMGQNKNVYVYKFMMVDTIEERIKQLQDNKMQMAESLLTGSKMQSSKLTLDDIKLLFNMWSYFIEFYVQSCVRLLYIVYFFYEIKTIFTQCIHLFINVWWNKVIWFLHHSGNFFIL